MVFCLIISIVSKDVTRGLASSLLNSCVGLTALVGQLVANKIKTRSLAGSRVCMCFYCLFILRVFLCVRAPPTNIVAANRIYTAQKRERKNNERDEKKRDGVYASHERAVLMLVHFCGALRDKTKPAA